MSVRACANAAACVFKRIEIWLSDSSLVCSRLCVGTRSRGEFSTRHETLDNTGKLIIFLQIGLPFGIHHFRWIRMNDNTRQHRWNKRKERVDFWNDQREFVQSSIQAHDGKKLVKVFPSIYTTLYFLFVRRVHIFIGRVCIHHLLMRDVSHCVVSLRLVSSRLVSSRPVSSRVVPFRVVASRLVSSRLVSCRMV